MRPQAKKLIAVVLILGLLIGGGLLVGISYFGGDKEPVLDENGNPVVTTQRINNRGNNKLPKLAVFEYGGMAYLMENEGKLYNLEFSMSPDDIVRGIQSGDYVGGSMSLDGLASTLEMFKEGRKDVQIVMITGRSNGADGIVGSAKVQTLKDLAKPGVKLGYTPYLVNHFILGYLMKIGTWDAAELVQLRKNMEPFSDVKLGESSFYNGDLDAIALWQPNLNNALAKTKQKEPLISSSAAPDLVCDVIFFTTEYIQKNPDKIVEFVDSYIQAVNGGNLVANLKRMESFAGMSDTEAKENVYGIDFAGWEDNNNFFKGSGKRTFFTAMDVWMAENKHFPEAPVNIEAAWADTLFYPDAVNALADKYKGTEPTTELVIETKPAVVDDEGINRAALISKVSSVEFEPQNAVTDGKEFLDKGAAFTELDAYVEIAKILSGTVIEIHGHAAPVKGVGKEFGGVLSEERAQTVADYFISKGIDPRRIQVFGHGSETPIKNADGSVNMEKSRRTVIEFSQNFGG